MGKYIVSTFGKWEVQRQKLFLSLISDQKIASKKTEEEIKKALFDDVNSAMIEKAYDFVRKNISTLAMRELTIQSYQQSLTVVLDSLSIALNIPKEVLNPYVQTFCEECEKSIEAIIDEMMKIGQVSNESKSDSIELLYGKDFKIKYPQLAQKLVLQDPEIIQIAKENIKKKIKPENFGKNESIIREQLIYIDEVAPKINSTVEFQEAFKAETGLTMEQYKNKIATNHSSFWKGSIEEVQKASMEGKKLTL